MTSTRREYRVFEEDKYGNCWFLGSYFSKEAAFYRAANEERDTGVKHVVKDEYDQRVLSI